MDFARPAESIWGRSGVLAEPEGVSWSGRMGVAPVKPPRPSASMRAQASES